MRLMLFAVVLLAGCAVPSGGAGPAEARLSQDRLTLVLSDGTTCRADWRSAPTGRFETCGTGFDYEVREVANPNLLRQIWVELTRAISAEGAVPPLAEVVITDAAGRKTVFASPPPVSEDGL